MKKEISTQAPTVEEAIDAALEELGVQQDVVEVEVVHDPAKKFFGRASDKPAEVRVRLKDSFVTDAAKVEDTEGDSPQADSALSESPEAEIAEDVEDSPASGPYEESRPERTDEELDQVADTGSAAIKGLLEHLGIEAEIEEYEGDEGEIILDIVGPELGILIGRHGRTLDALQTVVTTIVRRKLGWYHPLLVDVEGYRSRRRDKLEEIARGAAAKASRQERDVRLRPMNSFERKVVHLALRDDRRVTTESEGDEPNRSVVVSPR